MYKFKARSSQRSFILSLTDTMSGTYISQVKSEMEGGRGPGSPVFMTQMAVLSVFTTTAKSHRSMRRSWQMVLYSSFPISCFNEAPGADALEDVFAASFSRCFACCSSLLITLICFLTLWMSLVN